MTSTRHPITAASLDDPLYYLQNFCTVLHWVLQHHSDLLTADERHLLQGFNHLSDDSRALLVRMIMRNGNLFRCSKLRYAEISSRKYATDELAAKGWINPQPELDITQLFQLLTRAEILIVFASQLATAGLTRSANKADCLAALLTTQKAQPVIAQPLSAWWPEADDSVIELSRMPLIDRVRLMFFGNLYQSWSEFVLTELGHQRFEQVDITASSRAFQQRTEVDQYLQLQRCRERLDSGEEPAAVWADIPLRTAPNSWLEDRRGRLLFLVGQLAERRGDQALAQCAFGQSSHREARLKKWRLMERAGHYREVLEETRSALASPRDSAERTGMSRLINRNAKRLTEPALPDNKPVAIARIDLRLPASDLFSVEQLVLQHLESEASPVFYVENTLFNALFTLLCWPAIYAPVPGAFFHPFHAGPVDFFRPGFIARRQPLFEQCLSALDDGSYREKIYRCWSEKFGTTSTLVYWGNLDHELLNHALQCISPLHLKACFKRLISDLQAHRSGLPDLIQFWPAKQRYRLIEVKGPGDRLQDHQRRWLEFAQSQGMPVAVCYVQWSNNTTPEINHPAATRP